MITLLLNNDNLYIDKSYTPDINIQVLNHNQLNQLYYGKKISDLLSHYNDNDFVVIATNDLISINNIDFITDKSKSSDIIFIGNNNCIEIENLHSNDIINIIKSNKITLPSIICIKCSILKSIGISEYRNFQEVCMGVILSIVTNNLNSLIYTNDETESCDINLDNNMRAKILRELLQTTNIEDLFPNNNWEIFANESAAVSYHTLCAMFIKFNDLTSAKECLNLSSSFLDSPRSLALRGLIALEQNDDLNAVANIISSLQLYEKRKKKLNNIEKINTTPQDLNLIEERLNQGLDALNNKENHKAATLFADAVYTFDSFFKEQNIQKGKNIN